MLMLPELDTYGSLRYYARHPNNKYAQLGFKCLKKRGMIRLSWDVGIRASDPDQVQWYMDRRLLGRSLERDKSTGGAHVPTPDEINAAPVAERRAYYIACCKEAGFDIDPEALLKVSQGQ